MHHDYALLLLALLIMLSPHALAAGIAPTSLESAQAGKWVAEHFAGANAAPYSFLYGEKASAELLSTWQFHETTKKLDANRTERTQVYTDPATGLQVKCVS